MKIAVVGSYGTHRPAGRRASASARRRCDRRRASPRNLVPERPGHDQRRGRGTRPRRLGWRAGRGGRCRVGARDWSVQAANCRLLRRDREHPARDGRPRDHQAGRHLRRPGRPPRGTAVPAAAREHPDPGAHFGATYDDMRRMETLLRGSGADWVCLRLPQLVSKKAAGRYRIDASRPLPKARGITYADLATALLDSLTRPDLYRRTAYIAS
jgi:hypothetical protein